MAVQFNINQGTVSNVTYCVLTETRGSDPLDPGYIVAVDGTPSFTYDANVISVITPHVADRTLMFKLTGGTPGTTSVTTNAAINFKYVWVGEGTAPGVPTGWAISPVTIASGDMSVTNWSATNAKLSFRRSKKSVEDAQLGNVLPNFGEPVFLEDDSTLVIGDSNDFTPIKNLPAFKAVSRKLVDKGVFYTYPPKKTGITVDKVISLTDNEENDIYPVTSTIAIVDDTIADVHSQLVKNTNVSEGFRSYLNSMGATVTDSTSAADIAKLMRQSIQNTADTIYSQATVNVTYTPGATCKLYKKGSGSTYTEEQTAVGTSGFYSFKIAATPSTASTLPMMVTSTGGTTKLSVDGTETSYNAGTTVTTVARGSVLSKTALIYTANVTDIMLNGEPATSPLSITLDPSVQMIWIDGSTNYGRIEFSYDPVWEATTYRVGIKLGDNAEIYSSDFTIQYGGQKETVQLLYTYEVKTSATSGKVYVDGFKKDASTQLSAEEINLLAYFISHAQATAPTTITSSLTELWIDNSDAAGTNWHLSLGDKISVPFTSALTGTTIPREAELISFVHDDLTNQSIYGGTCTKAAFTFAFTQNLNVDATLTDIVVDQKVLTSYKRYTSNSLNFYDLAKYDASFFGTSWFNDITGSYNTDNSGKALPYADATSTTQTGTAIEAYMVPPIEQTLLSMVDDTYLNQIKAVDKKTYAYKSNELYYTGGTGYINNSEAGVTETKSVKFVPLAAAEILASASIPAWMLNEGSQYQYFTNHTAPVITGKEVVLRTLQAQPTAVTRGNLCVIQGQYPGYIVFNPVYATLKADGTINTSITGTGTSIQSVSPSQYGSSKNNGGAVFSSIQEANLLPIFCI